ncbi:hypothetical protein KP509_23G057300 [Ceratopteris richardii]|uniref:DUF7781 domain-containing protein n=1 Tax=Ceratopteris richardii TaxID=49495 RepID=A0A8T2S2B5_CERRI|nr:hypothetical protein KP509_23G057300 [Ceratopteris richardii]KAH7302117.1 hypothetical protein KP509_23G057300 [Ceratopteris richardii]
MGSQNPRTTNEQTTNLTLRRTVENNRKANALQMEPIPMSNTENQDLETSSNHEDAPSSWNDLYSIEWMPKDFLLKFRQHVEGYQIGANLEFDLSGTNACKPKFVIKPLSEDRKWKVLFEPRQADLRLLTKKIPIGPFLSLQVGLGHEFHNHTTGWTWKVTSSYGGDGVSQIRYKTCLPVFPGFDIRIGWNAEYVLPNIHGGLGTGEPIIGMNYGHLYGSIERMEAIITNAS